MCYIRGIILILKRLQHSLEKRYRNTKEWNTKKTELTTCDSNGSTWDRSHVTSEWPSGVPRAHKVQFCIHVLFFKTVYDPVFLHGLNEFSISSFILGSPAMCLTTWMSATHLSRERELCNLFTPSSWGIHQQTLAGLIASIACYYRWGNSSIAKGLGSLSFNWRPEQCDSTLTESSVHMVLEHRVKFK